MDQIFTAGNNLFKTANVKMVDKPESLYSNNTDVLRPYSALTQKVLNWFVFFLAFPAIEVLGNSITFYLFIFIGLRIGIYWTNNFRGKIFLLLFLLAALISTISAPLMPRHPGIFASIKILIQYIYWVMVGLFFISQKKRIDLLQVSKWIFYGIFTATFCFYFSSVKFGGGIFEINLGQSRNTYVFNLLCTIPISFYYLVNSWGKKKTVWFIPLYILIMLFTGGRSGAVLIILQMLFVASIIYPSVQRTAKIMIPIFALLYLVSQSASTQIYLDVLADQVETINPRFANLLRGEEDGDLSSDKSWLVRKLMVDKGIEIFKEFPVRGIGPNNFDYFDSKLATYNQYDRLSGASEEFLNSRSAHNSYIQLLAEMGLPGLLLMLSMLFIPQVFFFKKFFLNNMTLQYLPLVSLFGISMHLYAISAFTGAIAWIIIGLSWSILNNKKVQ